MTFYYWSPEGEKAWKNVGLPYPETVDDLNYKQFHSMTKRSPPDLNQETIGSLYRVLVGEEEYLVYNLTERRIDNLGNERHFFRSGLGKYSIPIPRYEMRQDNEGYTSKVVVGTAGIKTGYSLRFTEENIEHLVQKGWIVKSEEEATKINADRIKAAIKHKAAVADHHEFTRFMIMKEGHQRKYSVQSFDDFCTCTYHDLVTFGHTPTNEERETRLAAEEVAKAQRLTANANLADELYMAKERQRSGIPYK